jgi:mono/diheme cytochrome c family protein
MNKELGKTRPRGHKKPLVWHLTGLLLIFIGVLASLAIAGPPPSDGTDLEAAQPTSLNATLMQGETLFQATCAACHGVEGQGHVQHNAPALNGSEHSWHHPDQQIIGLIKNGGIIMPAVGATWSDEEIAAVLTYFKQWWQDWQRDFQPGTIGE